jgi:hypothetical protein
MTMSHTMPSRPTLLTISALSGIAPERTAPVRAGAGTGERQATDPTTPLFYILLGLIMTSLIFGLFPRF